MSRRKADSHRSASLRSHAPSYRSKLNEELKQNNANSEQSGGQQACKKKEEKEKNEKRQKTEKKKDAQKKPSYFQHAVRIRTPFGALVCKFEL